MRIVDADPVLDDDESSHNPLYCLEFAERIPRQLVAIDVVKDSQFKWQGPIAILNLTANSQIICNANCLILLKRDSYD